MPINLASNCSARSTAIRSRASFECSRSRCTISVEKVMVFSAGSAASCDQGTFIDERCRTPLIRIKRRGLLGRALGPRESIATRPTLNFVREVKRSPRGASLFDRDQGGSWCTRYCSFGHLEYFSMTLPRTFKRIRLDLARSSEFPTGSTRHGYEFVAPLDPSGHIDSRAVAGTP